MANWGAALKSVGDNLGKQIDYNMAESERKSREAREANLMAQRERFHEDTLGLQKATLAMQGATNLATMSRNEKLDKIAAEEREREDAHRAAQLEASTTAAGLTADYREKMLDIERDKLTAEQAKQSRADINNTWEIALEDIQTQRENMDIEKEDADRLIAEATNTKRYGIAMIDFTSEQKLIHSEFVESFGENRMSAMQAIKGQPPEVISKALKIMDSEEFRADAKAAKAEGRTVLTASMLIEEAGGKESDPLITDDNVPTGDMSIINFGEAPKAKQTGVELMTRNPEAAVDPEQAKAKGRGEQWQKEMAEPVDDGSFAESPLQPANKKETKQTPLIAGMTAIKDRWGTQRQKMKTNTAKALIRRFSSGALEADKFVDQAEKKGLTKEMIATALEQESGMPPEQKQEILKLFAAESDGTGLENSV